MQNVSARPERRKIERWTGSSVESRYFGMIPVPELLTTGVIRGGGACRTGLRALRTAPIPAGFACFSGYF